MSNPTLKIESYGTSSSLVPGSIQNAGNNSPEIFIINKQIDANTTPNYIANLTNYGIGNNKYIVKAVVENTTTATFSIGVLGTTDLFSENTYVTGTHNSQAVNYNNPISTATYHYITIVQSPGSPSFTLTLRLILINL